MTYRIRAGKRRGVDWFANDADVIDQAKQLCCHMTVPSWPRRYGVRAGEQVPVCIQDSRGRRLGPMRWGWKRERLGQRWLTIGRGETASGKPELRRAFSSHRCIVPITHWFGWTDKNTPLRMRWVIHVRTMRTLPVAGLWEVVKRESGDGEDARFIMLTVPAPPPLRTMAERMPAVLPWSIVDEWLASGTTIDRLRQVVVPYTFESLDAYRSNPCDEKDDPALLVPLEGD